MTNKQIVKARHPTAELICREGRRDGVTTSREFLICIREAWPWEYQPIAYGVSGKLAWFEARKIVEAEAK